MKKPDLLTQTPAQKKKDHERLTELKAQQLGAHAEELSKLLEIERSITETEKKLLGLDEGEERASLMEKLLSLHSERERQAGLRGKVLGGKEARNLEFINRSILEVRKNMKEADNEGRKGLKGRLEFLKKERAKFLS